MTSEFIDGVYCTRCNFTTDYRVRPRGMSTLVSVAIGRWPEYLPVYLFTCASRCLAVE